MDKHVTHGGDSLPRNLRIGDFEGISQSKGGLPNHLNVTDEDGLNRQIRIQHAPLCRRVTPHDMYSVEDVLKE